MAGDEPGRGALMEELSSGRAQDGPPRRRAAGGAGSADRSRGAGGGGRSGLPGLAGRVLQDRLERDHPADFDLFVTARSDALLRTAYLLTRDRALAEDLLQTALVTAWRNWRRIRTAPEAYVRRILLTTYVSWWRRRWRGEQPHGELPDVASTAPDEEGRIDLWTALGRLPRRQRATVVLRYYEGLTEAETADVLGCSVGTVKSQTSKALARLRIDPTLVDPTPVDPTPGEEAG